MEAEVATRTVSDSSEWDLSNRRSFQSGDCQADEEVRSFRDRMRSLETAATSVKIISSEHQQSSSSDSNGHTVYFMKVSSGVNSWTISKRFSDFFEFHKRLRKAVSSSIQLPSLPGKRYLGSSFDPSFIEERKQNLQVYLSRLVGIPEVWQGDEIVKFLDNESNSLLCVWNYERTRKMEKMLSKVVHEAESKTSLLEHELLVSNNEITSLQHKIATMEMLLLQQATGLAQEDATVGDDDDDDDAVPLRGKRNKKKKRSKNAKKSANKSKKVEPPSSDQVAVDAVNNEAVAACILDSPAKHRLAIDSDISTLSALELRKNIPRSSSSFSDEPLPSPHGSISQGSPKMRNLTHENMSSLTVLKAIALMKEESTDYRLVESPDAVNLSKQLKQMVYGKDESDDEFHECMSDPMEQTSVDSSPVAVEAVLMIDPTRAVESVAQDVSAAISDADDHESAVYQLFRLPSSADDWVSDLLHVVSELMEAIQPTQAAMDQRLKVYAYVRGIVSRALSAQLYPLGSFASRTFLPDSDIDLSVFLSAAREESWFVKANEALCLASIGRFDESEAAAASSDKCMIRNVTFVNAQTRLIKILVNNIYVDLSSNQISGLFSASLLDLVDDKINSMLPLDAVHLFKKSIILVKSWCKNDSNGMKVASGSLSEPRHGGKDFGPIMGSTEGKLSTHALNVMMLCIFSNFFCKRDSSPGVALRDPFQVFLVFIWYFSEFDWSRYAVTATGPVLASDVTSRPTCLKPLQNSESLRSFRTDLLRSFCSYGNPSEVWEKAMPNSRLIGDCIDSVAARARCNIDVQVSDCQASPTRTTGYRRSSMNIIDPFSEEIENLGRSVDLARCRWIQRKFSEGILFLCKSFSSKFQPKEFLKAMFPETYFSYNTDNKARSDVVQYFDDKGGRREVPSDRIPLNLFNFDIDNSETDFGILYANTVMRGIFSEDVFVMIISSILSTSKTGMPVGEIGKLLQEVICHPNLSLFLKETFGGLKKFIDMHPDVFIVMNDHQFNPTVILTLGAGSVDYSRPPLSPASLLDHQQQQFPSGGHKQQSQSQQSAKRKPPRRRQGFKDEDLFPDNPPNNPQFHPFIPSSTIMQMPPFMSYSPMGNMMPYPFPEPSPDILSLPPPNFPPFMQIPPMQSLGHPLQSSPRQQQEDAASSYRPNNYTVK